MVLAFALEILSGRVNCKIRSLKMQPACLSEGKILTLFCLWLQNFQVMKITSPG